MAIIRSFGAVQGLAGPSPMAWSSDNSIALFEGRRQSYGHIYKSQIDVRMVVDFLSQNVAHVGLHLFDRVSDTDRVRVSYTPVTEPLMTPNDYMTRYQLMLLTMQNLCIYGNAYWLKVRTNPLELWWLPACNMTVSGGLAPTVYTYTSGGKETDFAPSEVVHFKDGCDPDNPLAGLSRLESLRVVLAEQASANAYRQFFWKNAAQVGGVIERPLEAKHWDPEKVTTFQKMWQSRYAGGANAGKTPILQDGMQFKPTTHSAQESQYLEVRKLLREVIATAYQVPLPMVGILDHATFSNIREQHKHLYQDCLGPWFEMLQQEIERQYLYEFADTGRMYVEFNIAEKLKGSFEEQAAALKSATAGAAVMTQNEGRARLNLPRANDPGADELPKSVQFQKDDAADAPAEDVA